MVDSILEAAARVFVANGFERTTTNAIAEAAGVGIGSVYQYFPDKLALLAALHERHVIGLWGVTGNACVEACALPWPAGLRHVVVSAMSYNMKAGLLFGLFQKELSAAFPHGPLIDDAKSNYQNCLLQFFLAHKSRIKVEIEQAISMFPIIGKGIVTTVFHSRPEDVKNGRVIEEMIKIYDNYLSAP